MAKQILPHIAEKELQDQADVELKDTPQTSERLPLTGPVLNEMIRKHGMVGEFPPVDENELLDNEIDEIFQRQKWVLGLDEENITVDEDGPLFKVDPASEAELDILWEQMVPGLRLATKLINDVSRPKSFWVETVEAYKDVIGEEYANMTTKKIVAAFFKLVRSRTKFLFRWQEENVGASTAQNPNHLRLVALRHLGQPASAREGTPAMLKLLNTPKGTRSACWPTISMHSDFQKCFSLAHQKRLTRDQRLRLDFQFAVAVCHEVAHAFTMMCGGYLAKEMKLHASDPEAEAGYAWEDFFFAGLTMQFRPWATPYKGPLIAMVWIGKTPSPPTKFFIPMQWIQRLFLKSTWKHARASRRNGFLDYLSLMAAPSGGSEEDRVLTQIEFIFPTEDTKVDTLVYVLREYGSVVETYEEQCDQDGSCKITKFQG
ncbi:hypothetical protein BU16DRAFT_544134 [Lophium mytilinum]|uniref:Uncharacterized protein n=1 Tax=Lophium mytilinum TaxID=390894 RepID=A0A6A6QDM8_9PEZI|nr:hypothetical protein BU16DRAFT_544134 [Lophium mytilinum]